MVILFAVRFSIKCLEQHFTIWWVVTSPWGTGNRLPKVIFRGVTQEQLTQKYHSDFVPWGPRDIVTYLRGS